MDCEEFFSLACQFAELYERPFYVTDRPTDWLIQQRLLSVACVDAMFV